MNREEAFRRITEYWALVKRAEKQPTLSGERRAVMRVVDQNLPTIYKTLHDLAPDLRSIRASRVSEHLTAWRRVERALGILKAGRR